MVAFLQQTVIENTFAHLTPASLILLDDRWSRFAFVPQLLVLWLPLLLWIFCDVFSAFHCSFLNCYFYYSAKEDCCSHGGRWPLHGTPASRPVISWQSTLDVKCMYSALLISCSFFLQVANWLTPYCTDAHFDELWVHIYSTFHRLFLDITKTSQLIAPPRKRI